jgi:uncharacterized membrane protein HdeD (DUF308 family)
MILTRLTHYWWTYVARGFLAVGFGMFAAGWPGLTRAALTIAFGTYALMDGLFLFASAIGEWRHVSDSWLMLLEGIVGVLVGTVMIGYAPALTGLGLPICVAAWSLAIGVFETATAIQLRQEAEGELWLLAAGIAAIGFAVLVLLLMCLPATEPFVLRWLIATYAIFFGVLLMDSGVSLHELRLDLELGVIGLKD